LSGFCPNNCPNNWPYLAAFSVEADENFCLRNDVLADEANVYTRVGKEFASHQSVDHSRDEYAYLDKLSGRIVSMNVSENFYSILKRGIMGVYHQVSEAHLHRCLAEFDFRYNNRSALGVEDTERVAQIVKGTEDKRLTYYAAD
jgi:hypothetical protein